MSSAAFYLKASQLLLADGFSQGYLRIEQGHITAIETTPSRNLPMQDCSDGMLCPGFIDIQVNGGGGALFNTTPSVESLATIFAAHQQYGTTSMLPTVITDDLTVMQQAADAVAAARAKQMAGIIGIHFEGPHLAQAKRGCHPQYYLRPLTAAEMTLYCRQDLGVVMLTLAPETVPVEQIAALTAAGVIVSLGHSNAGSAQILPAIAAGASCVTHLYNGMSNLTSREPGLVGTALADPRLYCGIIFDGEHLHPLSAQIAYQMKGEQRLILVTDAMSPVGTAQQEFNFAGGRVTRQGMKLTNSEGSLAGSVLDMASAVRYAVQQLAIDTASALRMASSTPAQLLKLAHLGQIKVGARADLVWLNTTLQVKQCWLAGQSTSVA